MSLYIFYIYILANCYSEIGIPLLNGALCIQITTSRYLEKELYGHHKNWITSKHMWNWIKVSRTWWQVAWISWGMMKTRTQYFMYFILWIALVCALGLMQLKKLVKRNRINDNIRLVFANLLVMCYYYYYTLYKPLLNTTTNIYITRVIESEL